MLKTTLKLTIIIISAALLGFFMVNFLVNGSLFMSYKTSLTIVAQVNGRDEIPIQNAKLILYTPEKLFLGFTDKDGKYSGEVKVPRGKILKLEAEGKEFSVKKDIAIPYAAKYSTTIIINPQEELRGNVSIESLAKDKINSNEGYFNERIEVVQADEKALTGHNIKEYLKIIEKISLKEKTFFRAKKVKKIVLRPIFNKDYYMEILAYSRDNDLLSSFLFITGSTDILFIQGIFKKMFTNIYDDKLSGKFALRIETWNPNGTRAYLNGYPLRGKPRANSVEFNFDSTQLFIENTVMAIAATSDGSPLIRKIFQKKDLTKSIDWSFPSPYLSQRLLNK